MKYPFQKIQNPEDDIVRLSLKYYNYNTTNGQFKIPKGRSTRTTSILHE